MHLRHGSGFARRSLGVGLLILAMGLILAAFPSGMTPEARLALFGFGGAAIAWVLLPLNPAFVALAASAFLAVAGVIPQRSLTGALGADVIWLMIGAFILGEAVTRSGLAERLTLAVAGRARRVDHLFWRVSAMLLPLAFVIPSTSGRAAVLLPLHRSLAATLSESETRALALLIPAVILVTTIAALTGAGSHLIANDLLAGMTGERIGFLQWMLYGLPFAAAAGAASCFVVLRLFLATDERKRPLAVPSSERRPWSRDERVVAIIASLTVGLWLTESLHGTSIATVALLGALALMSPFGAIRWRDGIKAVNWELILFVGAALVLGKSLIETGAAGWLTDRLFSAVGFSNGASALAIVAGVAAIMIGAHLVMLSHAARAAALVPPLIVLAESLKADPVAIVFIGTVGMNYCLTLPVSSKALLMFQGIEAGLKPAALLKLSALLAPLHLCLIVVFYFGYWQWVGLAL